ncbi:hypothetical protein Hanom_Chr01g00045891 [Helianthus anomalus]
MKEWMDVFANNDGKRQDEEYVSSDDCSEQTQVFDQSSTDINDDEEEIQINIGKTQLSPESFNLYFADRLEKVK